MKKPVQITKIIEMQVWDCHHDCGTNHKTMEGASRCIQLQIDKARPKKPKTPTWTTHDLLTILEDYIAGVLRKETGNKLDLTVGQVSYLRDKAWRKFRYRHLTYPADAETQFPKLYFKKQLYDAKEVMKIDRCEFDDVCDFCENPTAGSFVKMIHNPEDVSEADYHICGKCAVAKAAELELEKFKHESNNLF